MARDFSKIQRIVEEKKRNRLNPQGPMNSDIDFSQIDKNTIAGYESIPNYNAVERAFDKDKAKAYNTKQRLLDSYEKAQSRETQRFINKNNISDSMLESAFGVNSGKNAGTMGFTAPQSEQSKKDTEYLSSLPGVNMDYLEKYYKDSLNKKVADNIKDYAENDVVGSNLVAPVLNTSGSLGKNLETAGSWLSGKPMSNNSTASTFLGGVNDIRQETKEKIDEKAPEPLKKALNVGYDATSGVLDFGSALVMAGGNPALASAIMANNAAGNSFYDATERGVNPNQVMATGLTNAGAEYVMNLLPMGAFDDVLKGGSKNLVKNIAKQGVSEAIEEGVTEAVSTVADTLINKDKSNIALAKQQYMSNGMTEEDATKQAIKDAAKNVGYSALIGGLSGSTIGGGTTLYNNMVGRNNVDNASELDPLGALNATVEGEQQTIDNQPAEIEPLNTAQPTAQEPTSLIQPLETDNPINVTPTQVNATNQPFKIGKATTIKSPYTGTKPIQTKTQFPRIEIEQQKYDDTVTSINTAQIDKALNSDNGIKTVIQKVYEALFGDNGEAFHIPVEDMTFDGDSYVVDVNKSSVGKLVKDGPISAEKMCVLNDIDNILANAEYLDSANYDNHNNKNSGVIRYDYFETPVKINGEDYIVTFDVEVQKGSNRYRMHRVINEMNLAKATDGVEVPTTSEVRTNDVNTAQKTGASLGLLGSSTNSITNPGEKVNENTPVVYNTKSIEGFDDASKQMNKLIGMYGNDSIRTMHSQVMSLMNEYIATNDSSKFAEAMEIASEIDRQLLGKTYKYKATRKGTKGENARAVATYTPDSYIETLYDEHRNYETMANLNAPKNGVSNVAPETQPKVNNTYSSMADNISNVTGKTKVSQTATNSFRNSNMFKKSQLSTDTLNNMILEGGFDVDVVSENESLERASAMLDNDYNGTISRLQSNEQYSGVDTDAAMMVLEDKLNQAMQSGDYMDSMKWARMIVDKSHKLGQGLQALAKYTRTATGTVVKAQKMADTSVNNYFDKNKNLEKSVGKFGAALKRIGDTSPKQEVAPKTREQVVTEIRNALNKEASSIADLFSEENINEFADMIMAGRSVDEIQSQIEHFLMHGTTYAFTVDENVRRETSQKLRNALDAVVYTKDTTKAPKSIEQIRKEVANTIAEENTSIYKNFTDEDIEYLARAIQNGMPTKDLTAMLKQKLVTGSFGISDADLREITNLFNEADKYGEFSKEAYDLHQKAYAIAAKYVGNSSFMDKWNAWRYLAMLGNTRTHIKNFGGNTVMNLVSGVKNNIAATIESGINTATGGKIGRTKSILNPVNGKDKNLISASKKDANNMYTLLNKGGSKYDMKKEIEGNRNVFKSRLLNSLSNFNSMALEAEDFFFLQSKYSTSLAGYLKANGKDASIFDSTNEADVEMLNKAREYAIKEAQQATFHEASKAAEALNNFSKTLKQGGIGSKTVDVLLEGVLPFKKTPINILKQGIRYSPAGLVKGLTYDLQQLKKGNKTATEVINDISTGLTGSSIVMLGAFMFANGLISSSGSADKEEATEEALIGKQNYAIQFPDGSSYTIDWMAPSSLPLFVGVELGKMWQGEEIDFADAMISIANPIVEMSMLQGISNTLESIRYGESSLGDLFVNTATSYVTQGVPTVLGQVARAVDDTRRATYTGDSGVANSFKKAINKSINKVPVLSESQEPYVDEWGRTQENEGGSFLGRLAYNMLSPGYYSKENVTSVDAELMNLANLTGDTSIYPNYTDSNPMNEGKLSPEKYTKYATTKGQAQFEALDTLFTSDAYKGLPDTSKVNVIGDIYNFTNALAKSEVLGYDIEGTDTYKKTYSVYKDKGYDGVALYTSIKETMDGSSNAAHIDAVNKFDISDEEKGYYLTKLKGKLSSEALSVYESEGYAGVYQHYYQKALESKVEEMRQQPQSNTTVTPEMIDAVKRMRGQSSSNTQVTPEMIEAVRKMRSGN